MLVQEIEPRDNIFVQHAHLGARLVVHVPHVLTEASFNVLHFLAEASFNVLHFLVEASFNVLHFLAEASFNALHFLAEALSKLIQLVAEIRAGGGKLSAYLGSEFQNLHFERVDAIGQDLQLFHVLFQNLNAPLDGF